MEILGIGPMELLLILIVMLLVFGPDKLPQMGAKLGRTMRDMRRATRAISNEINATRDAITSEAKPITDPLHEVADAAKSAGSLVAAAKNPGQAIRESVLKEMQTPVAPVAEAEPPVEAENSIAPPEMGHRDEAEPPVEPEAPRDLAKLQPEPQPAALPEPETPLALPAPDPDASSAPRAGDEPPSTPPSTAGAEPDAGEQ